MTALSLKNRTGGKIAIFAGDGSLPRLLANRLESAGAAIRFAALEGREPEWLAGRETTLVTLQNFISKYVELYEEGCRTAVFAGGIGRPQMLSGDAEVPVDLESGDDAMVRKLIEMLEAIGFAVVGAHEFLPDLLAGSGILTDMAPEAKELRDAAHAARIVHALGFFDVGQAAVVAQGVCLGVETVQGTDHLVLASGEARRLLPNPARRSGVLYKAPKPEQDLRLDFPAIGPETASNVAKAGLAGIAIEANGVMILDRAETVRLANEARLFIWSRNADA
ncbi:MAG: UDP-2,3-diacylglucosamine diphosphatase LpxI [Albidovulum sp.]|nr:UDP-2,3-diacylglucosamine diphosphatase LpxI [Albidovulum sp.]